MADYCSTHRKRVTGCPDCLEARRLYERSRPKRPRVKSEWKPIEHGTYAGHARCRRSGVVCLPCLQAKNAYKLASDHAVRQPKPPIYGPDELPFTIPAGWGIPSEDLEAWKVMV